MTASSRTPGLFEIKASVQWQDATGTLTAPHEQSLVRLVADPEWGSRHRAWPPAGGGKKP